MESNEKKELILNDEYFSAYFLLLISSQKLKDFTITPFFKNPRSISWKIQGPDILQELEKIYSGVDVPLLDYIRSLKEIRHQISILKG